MPLAVRKALSKGRSKAKGRLGEAELEGMLNTFVEHLGSPEAQHRRTPLASACGGSRGESPGGHTPSLPTCRWGAFVGRPHLL